MFVLDRQTNKYFHNLSLKTSPYYVNVKIITCNIIR